MKRVPSEKELRQAELSELFFDSGSLRRRSPAARDDKVALRGASVPNKMGVLAQLRARVWTSLERVLQSR